MDGHPPIGPVDKKCTLKLYGLTTGGGGFLSAFGKIVTKKAQTRMRLCFHLTLIELFVLVSFYDQIKRAGVRVDDHAMNGNVWRKKRVVFDQAHRIFHAVRNVIETAKPFG